MGRPKKNVQEVTDNVEVSQEELAPRTERRKRVPVSGARNILTVANKDPNYVYRWVLDIPGRMDIFKDAGYEVVIDKPEVGDPTVDRHSQLGSAVTLVRGVSTLVLMRIPREWYNEDQQAKQEEIDALEETMRHPEAADYGSVQLTRK